MLKLASICAASILAVAAFSSSAEAQRHGGGARMGGHSGFSGGARMGGNFGGARTGGFSGARMGMLAPASIVAASGQAELALLVVAAFIAAASGQADTHTATETEVMGTDTVDMGTGTVAIGPT